MAEVEEEELCNGIGVEINHSLEVHVRATDPEIVPKMQERMRKIRSHQMNFKCCSIIHCLAVVVVPEYAIHFT